MGVEGQGQPARQTGWTGWGGGHSLGWGTCDVLLTGCLGAVPWEEGTAEPQPGRGLDSTGPAERAEGTPPPRPPGQPKRPLNNPPAPCDFLSWGGAVHSASSNLPLPELQNQMPAPQGTRWPCLAGPRHTSPSATSSWAPKSQLAPAGSYRAAAFPAPQRTGSTTVLTSG